MKFRRYLDICTSIAVIIAAGLLSLKLLTGWFGSGPHQVAQVSRNGVVSSSALLGQSVKGAIRPKANGGVLLVVSRSCHYCEQSLDFYRTLPRLLVKGQRSLAVMMPDSKDQISRYVNDNGLGEALPIEWANLAELKINTTPRLLVYDSPGKIVRSWAGLLDKARQEEVYAALGDQDR